MVAILRNFDQTVVYPEDGNDDSTAGFQSVIEQFGGCECDYSVVVAAAPPDACRPRTASTRRFPGRGGPARRSARG